MNYLNLITFFFFSLFILSVWIKKDVKIYGPLLGLSIFLAFLSQSISLLGLLILFIGGFGFYKFYKKPNFLLFLGLIGLILSFPLKLLTGFTPIPITEKFLLSFSGISLASIVLILNTELAKNKKDWKNVFLGIGIGICGIGVLAILATITKATRWQPQLPSFFFLRLASNLFLTCVAQEVLYRNFIQKELSRFLINIKYHNIISILLTSLIFTIAHIYWSPNLMIGLFVFVASLLYGFVYFKTNKIEAAIITHFMLNVIHMVFFKYHAM